MGQYKTVMGFVKACNKLSNNEIAMIKGYDKLDSKLQDELYNLSEEMAQISNNIINLREKE